MLLAGVLVVLGRDTQVFTLRTLTLWTGSWRPWLLTRLLILALVEIKLNPSISNIL